MAAMTLADFKTSLTGTQPPADLALAALWWDAKGDWQAAHEHVQRDEGNPACDWVHAYLDKLLTWADTAASKLTELGCDVIWIGDDFGTQSRMLLSPQMFREFIKPKYDRLFTALRRINVRKQRRGELLIIRPILFSEGLSALRQPNFQFAGFLPRRPCFQVIPILSEQFCDTPMDLLL